MSVSSRVVVVGAGLMGTGIAYCFVAAGFSVTLIDSNAAALARSLQQIGDILDDAVTRTKLTPEQATAARARLQGDGQLQPSDAVLLIETATEKLEVKQEILRQAERALPATAVLASNTSALSITEIAAVVTEPGRVLGMHFFNPVQKMKLLELVRGLGTSEATLEQARRWGEQIGKTCITVTESPGFTTSRMSALMGNEAMTMLAEGVASAEDIDTALKLAFNHPMGPLELGDLTGWDTRLAVLQYLHQTLGEKFRPCPLIGKMVKAGRTGRKVGRGVYAYDADGRKIPGSGLRGA